MFLPVIGLLLSGETSAAPEAPMSPPETIILISLDTTRADRMSCYGYEHETTPNIDALAEESLFFEHPFATAPMTLPSHSSMFTGLIPPTHGVHENLKSHLPAVALTLPEILRQQGFATYGFVSTSVLRPDRGLNQGFDHYDHPVDPSTDDPALGDAKVQRSGKETTARALQWLSDNAQKKKFIFIHYFDAHAPYEPPAPFDTRFEDPYDGEIAFTDYCVGQILDRLKELGLYDNALIALVGDHGEMLGEHGEESHYFFIHQNALRVPMMFKPPGAHPSRRIAEPSSLIDVTPTILSMAGLSVPEAMQGIDLARYLHPDFTLPNRAIYAESMTPTAYNCSSLLGIVMGRWHYIQTKRPELYDRLEDPAEKINLIAQYPAQASKMKDRRKRLLSEAERSNVDTSMVLDAEDLQQLESLGYLDGDVTVDYSFEEGEEDAKDMIAVRNRIFAAKRMARAGQAEKAVESCLEIIQQHPKIAETYQLLANVHTDLKENDKAIAVLQQLLTQFPNNTGGLKLLSFKYEQQKEYSKAIDILNEIITQGDDDAIAYNRLIYIYMKQGAATKVIDAVQRRRSVLPDDVQTLMALGGAYHRLNDAPNALTSFLDVLTLDPESISAHVSAADMYLKMRNPEQALLYYEQALEYDTKLPGVHRLVASIKLNKANPNLYDPPSALNHAQIALQLQEDRTGGKCDIPAIFDTLARAWVANGNFDEAIEAAAKAMELYKSKGPPAQAERMKRLISEFEKKRAKRQ